MSEFEEYIKILERKLREAREERQRRWVIFWVVIASSIIGSITLGTLIGMVVNLLNGG